MSTRIKKTVTPIDIKKLEVWDKGNVRKHEIYEDIDELAKNIKEIGLINPLIVFEQSPDKFEVISGQRRLEACRLIGHTPIDCMIIDKPSTQSGMLLSLSENLYRRQMTPDDISDACDVLYQKYENIETVGKRLGVSSATVRKYLGYRKVPEEIKDMVRRKLITASQALLIYTQYPDLKKQIKIANEMAKITDRVYKVKFTRAVKESRPTDDVEQIKSRAKELHEGKEYKIFLHYKTSNVIEKSASEMEVEPEFIISEVMDDWTEKRQKNYVMVK